MSSLASHVLATNKMEIPDKRLTATFDGKLHLDPKSQEIFVDRNASPGDQYLFNIIFTNETGRDVIFSLRDVVNLLEIDSKSTAFMGQFDVVVYVDGKLFYQNNLLSAQHSSTDFATVPSNGKQTFQFSLSVKESMDNRFQGAIMKVRFDFEVRMDLVEVTDPKPTVPETKPTTPETKPLVPQTGDANFTIMIQAILASSIFLLISISKRTVKK